LVVGEDIFLMKKKEPNQRTTAQRAGSPLLVLLMVRPPRVADR
jgi:hypothetical protein